MVVTTSPGVMAASVALSVVVRRRDSPAPARSRDLFLPWSPHGLGSDWSVRLNTGL